MTGRGGGTVPAILEPGRPVLAAAGLALALTLAAGTVETFEATGSDPSRPEIVDFHPFHIAGRLALQGPLRRSL